MPGAVQLGGLGSPHLWLEGRRPCRVFLDYTLLTDTVLCVSILYIYLGMVKNANGSSGVKDAPKLPKLTEEQVLKRVKADVVAASRFLHYLSQDNELMEKIAMDIHDRMHQAREDATRLQEEAG